jgi:hypothetical protein
MQSKLFLEEFVINKLRTGLPTTYTYHNYIHTLYVIDKTLGIAKKGICNVSRTRLLKTDASWQDTGHIDFYTKHEEKTNEEIHSISAMKMATKTPQAPLNKLKELPADTDHEYLETETEEKNPGICLKNSSPAVPH